MEKIRKLLFELIGASDGQCLMATSQKKKIIGHVEAVSEEGDEALDGLIIPACIVPEKEVVHEFGVAALVDDVRQLKVVS